MTLDDSAVLLNWHSQVWREHKAGKQANRERGGHVITFSRYSVHFLVLCIIMVYVTKETIA